MLSKIHEKNSVSIQTTKKSMAFLKEIDIGEKECGEKWRA